MSDTVDHCTRCGMQRPAGDDPLEPLEWEATGDGELICPGCLTPAEQQAIDEDMMSLADTTSLDDPSDPRGDPHE